MCGVLCCVVVLVFWRLIWGKGSVVCRPDVLWHALFRWPGVPRLFRRFFQAVLTPYEQFFIQAFHKSGSLISKQNPGEPNPIHQMAINHSQRPTWPSHSNSNLHSTRNLQHNSPQLQPATSSTTRYVSYSHIYLHPLHQPAHHPQHPTLVAPSSTCITHSYHQKQAWRMHQNTNSQYAWPD